MGISYVTDRQSADALSCADAAAMSHQNNRGDRRRLATTLIGGLPSSDVKLESFFAFGSDGAYRHSDSFVSAMWNFYGKAQF